MTGKDLLEWGAGVVLIALPPDPLETRCKPVAQGDLRQLLRVFPRGCFLGAALRYDGRDHKRITLLGQISQTTGLPLVAVGEVMMHRAPRADHCQMFLPVYGWAAPSTTSESTA